MISIVIVNYKVPDLLIKCIEKVNDSKYSGDIEIIVVDNDSQDNSKERALNAFPEITWIQNPENLGFATAVNRGVENSKGDLILLLNPDCELHPEALQRMETFAENNPAAGVIGGKMLSPDGSFQRQCRRSFPKPGPAFFRLFGFSRLFPSHRLSTAYELSLDNIDQTHEVDAVSGALLFTPRSVWTQVDGMDEGYFLYGEDLDYCYRVLKAGYRILYYPKAIVFHIKGASRKKRPVRTLWHTHYAMHRFYKHHIAEDKFFLVNHSIYLMIWIRWIGLFLKTVFFQR